MLTRAIDTGWNQLLEEIGLWMPLEIINKEYNDKPQGAKDYGNQDFIYLFNILSILFLFLSIWNCFLLAYTLSIVCLYLLMLMIFCEALFFFSGVQN